MIDWDEVRTHFPALENKVYLNTAGGGPMCREAVDAVHDYYDECLREGDTLWNQNLERVESTRKRLAHVLRVSETEIAFLSNASHGLNLVADMLHGDGEVLAVAADFPSVTLPWLRRGRNVRFVDAPGQIEPAIGPDTEIVAVSFVQYKTGARVDLERLAALCHDRNVHLVVDATQGFGVFDIDLGRAPVDALVFSAYKWATAGYGIAPLCVRQGLLKERGLPSVGWRSAREPYDLESTKLDLTTDARGLELGHPPFAGIFALGGALELIERVGIDAIEARVQSLVDTLHRGLDARGMGIDSPRERNERSAITMLRVPNPAETAAELARQNIFVSARGEGLRVSLHYYNNEADIQKLLDAL